MKMKTMMILFTCLFLSVSCGIDENVDKKSDNFKKYMGQGFVIEYPAGFTVNSRSNGVVMGGDFTVNVKIELSENKKKGSFPKDYYETDKVGITESQFVKNWVGSNQGYIYKSDILVVQLVSFSGATVSVMCSANQDTVDFPVKAAQVLASFEITDEIKLIESVNVQIQEKKELLTQQQQTIQVQEKTIDKQGLKPEDYYENDDIFIKLPRRYFAKQTASDIMILGVQQNVKKPEAIVIQQLEKTGLPLQESANMMMGGIKSMPVQLGSNKYFRYDQPGSSGDDSQIVLLGQSLKYEVKITIKGSIGLSGSNMELLESIVFK